MFERFKRTFKDVSSDAPLAIGSAGLLTAPTRGRDGPGEVQVELNGAATTFIAYSDEPLDRGTRVVIYDIFGGRNGECRKGQLGESVFFYHVPDPDEAMLIAGGKAGSDNAPFKVVTGRGAWVIPGLRHVSFMGLSMQEAEVTEQCVTKQGITLRVQAVCAFKVGPETDAIVNAAQRFLSDQDSMATLTGRIFAGHLRSIIGAMTVEEIITQRQALASQVLEASKEEMGKLGLLVDSFQISSVDDMGSGYVAAMAAPHTAAIQRAANIAQAEADQESAKAQQESQRKQAEYQRDTSLLKAQTRGEETKAEAEAAQAGPLAEAEAQKAVTTSQTSLAQDKADLRQQQLQSEVVKPAEAQAQKTKIEAEADAEATRVRAEAAASNDRVSLDLRLIEQLPEIVERASKGLANANITMLDGADGLSRVTASLISQGRALFDAAQSASFEHGRESDHAGQPNGSVPPQPKDLPATALPGRRQSAGEDGKKTD